MTAKDIVELLQQAGLSQSQIAQRSGLRQPYVNKVATGRIKDVSLSRFRKLEAALHAHIQALPKAT